MPLVKAKGINLRSIKVGEADKIITIFSRELGKISAIAKGSRKPKSKFGGRLEVFSYNDYFLATGKSLYIVNQVETIETFYGIKDISAASFLVRLAGASIDNGQKNTRLFDLLLSSLKALAGGADPLTLRVAFEAGLAEIEGFFPQLKGCVSCKKPVRKEPESVTFNHTLGGLLCSRCSGKGGEKIPYRLVKMIGQVSSRWIEGPSSFSLDPGDAEKLDLLLKTFISEHIGKDVRNW